MKRFCFAALVSLALAAPAQAARPSYSYFDAAYLKTEIDGSSSGAAGARLAVNASLTRWFYLTGGHDYRDIDSAFQGEDIKSQQTSLGFGVHSLKSKFQLFAAGTYERSEVSGDENTGTTIYRIYDREEGYGLQIGARLPIDRFELQADYKYFNFGDFPDGSRNDEDRYRFSALGHLTPTFALTGSYEFFEQARDVDQWTVGLRVYFNSRHDLPRKKR